MARALNADLPITFENDRMVAEAKLILTKCAHQVAGWTEVPEIVEAAASPNAGNADMTRIKEIDARWVANESLHELQHDLMSNACAVTLRRLMGADPQRQYLDAFATDAHGALVCMSNKTSDYWQADEAKWLRAYNEGRGAMYVGPLTDDESFQQPVIQIAVPIRRDSQVLGVLVVGKGVQNMRGFEREEVSVSR